MLFKKIYVVVIVVFGFYANVATAEKAFDATMSITVAQFKQFLAANYTRFIARIQQSKGQPDQIGITNLKNAIEAGFSSSQFKCDSYIYPCTCNGACPPPGIQVNNTLSIIKARSINPGVIWLDIENPRSWYDSIKYNRQFIDDMIKAVRAAGFHPGIYTTENAWSEITGNLTDYGGYMPLWWAKHNGMGGSDCEAEWKSFGGWKYLYLHQYDINSLQFGVTFNPSC